MAKVRMVLDYVPCASCKDIPPKNQKYLCTVCHRLSRVVTTEQQVPHWNMEKGVLAPTDEKIMDDLKPTVIVHEPGPEILERPLVHPPLKKRVEALEDEEKIDDMEVLEPKVEEPVDRVGTAPAMEFEILEFTT